MHVRVRVQKEEADDQGVTRNKLSRKELHYYYKERERSKSKTEII